MMHILYPLFLLLPLTNARIHHVEMQGDDRSHYTVSTFGFLKRGTQTVNVTNMLLSQHVDEIDDKTYGFTLDVSSSSGANSYFEDASPERCIFKENLEENFNRSKKGSAEAIVELRLDFKNRKILINRIGDKVRNLIITNQTMENFWKNPHRRDVSNDRTSDSFLFPSRQRRALEEKPKMKANQLDEVTEDNGNNTGTTVSKDNTTSSSETAGEQQSSSKGQENKQGDNADVTSKSLYKELPMYSDAKNAFSFFFMVAVTEESQEGMFTLNFHNCKAPEPISYTLDLIEVNRDSHNNFNYLSASKMPLPTLYFVLCIVYLVMAIIWNTVLCKSKESVYKIHYVMMIVVFVKSLSCLFHGINFHFIQKEGTKEEAWAVLFYIAYLTRGVLLLVTIILIGAGWAFIKHILSEREKKLFLIVIPLQILDNIAWIIVEESEEAKSQYRTWKEIFILIDLLCCGAILFPVVWSIKHLQEASRADGKAEFSLTKLKLFRQFYIMVVCYIYFTRIIVYLLEMTVPFKYEWLSEFFRELATIVFFTITAYKFRPATDNPYLQVPTDDEEDLEMDTVIVGEASRLDMVKKVNQNKDSDTRGLKLRESSHEYD